MEYDKEVKKLEEVTRCFKKLQAKMLLKEGEIGLEIDKLERALRDKRYRDNSWAEWHRDDLLFKLLKRYKNEAEEEIERLSEVDADFLEDMEDRREFEERWIKTDKIWRHDLKWKKEELEKKLKDVNDDANKFTISYAIQTLQELLDKN